jgi:ribosomal protein S18 acetylase RimI-like enzyme
MYTDPDITIRLALPEELPQVSTVLERAYETSYGIDDNYRAELHRIGEVWAGVGDIWVAIHEDRIAGAIVTPTLGQPPNFVNDPPEPELGFRQLGVDPSERGRGIGLALIAHVVRLAIARDIKYVDLYTQTHMEQAQQLYRSLGFVRAPERDWFVPGTDHELLAYVLSI